MTLAPGARVGPYEVVAPLGAGGMGEVYRARDSKLERDVAIKVLSPEFVTSTERLARFQREARVLASLNHPRIAAIYGLEDSSASTGSGQAPALVMELVEGPTLADRLAAGPLPIDDALRIARQIAEGLEYAHEQGIVHRDLKPANVKVGADESVKILDFGLAKAVESDSGTSPANSPTATWMATEAGVLLGTASYMAPEQAKGKAVDRRADIWAFGCVLYEMLTGTPAFGGETVADILASVMRAEPDWTLLPSSTPPALRDLVRRCLRKDVRERLQAIGDARIALGEVVTGGAAEAPSTSASRPARPMPWLSVGAAGVAAGAILAAVVVWKLMSSPPPAKDVTRFSIVLPPGQTLAGLDQPAIALSDDGRQMAYVATSKGADTRQIYVRAMDSTEPRAIAGTEGALDPFFSPDGHWLGFFADGKLKKIPVGGGAAQTLTEVTNSFGAAWTTAHTIVFVPLGSAIQQVSDDGGTPALLTRMRPGEVDHNWPALLPGGAGVLFSAGTARDEIIAVQPLAPGDHTNLKGQVGAMPRYAPSGHLVYVQGENLMAVRFDVRTLEARAAAPAVVVVKGVLGGQFALSGNGSLAYVAGHAPTPSNRLVWVSRTGLVQPLNAPERVIYQPRISPDGHKVVADVVDGSAVQVWQYDLHRGTSAPFTFDGSNRHGVWTRDSQSVVFQSSRDGTQRLYWQRADGSGQPQPLMKEAQPASEGVFNIPYSVSADGLLTYVRLVPTKNAQFLSLRLPLEASARQAPDAEPQRILESSAADGAPQLSPDGRWLAYASDGGGLGREIYVRPFSGPGGPWQMSNDGGNEPQWNPNGKELFYRSGRKMMAVDVDTRAGFTVGRPHVLFEGDFDTAVNGYVRANYDVSPDGQRFLMVQRATPSEPPPSEISVVLNWSEELRRLVPAGP